MIRTEKLTFSIGQFRLDEVSIEMARNEYFVLLGPPGSGKSILLECLCGLRRPAAGRIFVDGRDITREEPRKRGIGYVPQDYALFPHLSVEDNIAFGLRSTQITRTAARGKARQTADMLGIAHLLGRNVAGLSGGEKQRAALARALVKKPKVLLLDEPVCALDEATRQSVCAMLRVLRQELDIAVMHVSHNLEEAFSVADHAAILNAGRIEQAGPLDSLLRKPANEFVARFMRSENILDAQAIGHIPDEHITCVRIGPVQFQIPGRHEGAVKVVIRPEDVIIEKADAPPLPNTFAVQLLASRDFGSFIRAQFTGPPDLVAHLPRTTLAAVAAGPIRARLLVENLCILE
ncbi:MAG: ATP-binding cassette domain-containing protein [Phycisphaerae bacterium]|nr:ATP-binding cassette domain-containing protein [Phycisphaerae bacterium]